MRIGISPCALMLARGLDTGQLDLLKYSSNQPRVPAGNPDGGQWTSGDAATTPRDQSASRSAATAANSQGTSHPASNAHHTSSDIHLIADNAEEEEEREKEKEKEKELPPAERRALRLPPRKEDVEEGHGIPLQTPLVEESDPVGVGRHAGESIPARSPARNFTVKERQEINRIGRETGCHTCGTKDSGTPSGNFIPDHQPPSSLNSSGVPQRLYPHCATCSNKQGWTIWYRRRGERK